MTSEQSLQRSYLTLQPPTYHRASRSATPPRVLNRRTVSFLSHESAALVVGVEREVALARADALAHVAHEAVPVEVLTRVLVEQPVTVGIVRANAASVRLRGEAVHVAAVRVHDRLDVDRLFVEQLRDGDVLP